jgi:hypothetical protein
MKQNLIQLSQQHVAAREKHLTLLGINVRLLILKQEARSHTNGFKNKIASTRQLVANSAGSVRQAGRKNGG